MSEALALRECNLIEKICCWPTATVCFNSATPVHCRGVKRKQEYPHLYLHGDLKLRQSACFFSLVSAG